MTLLRTLLFRRLIVGLALAGLAVTLAPGAQARTVAQERLADALGHEDAVQIALAASHGSADPQEAFILAYAEATGQDADDVRSRLDGDALWLATEIPAPDAVLVPASTSPTTVSRGLGDAVRSAAPRLAVLTCDNAREPAPLGLARGDRPRAHGARGP